MLSVSESVGLCVEAEAEAEAEAGQAEEEGAGRTEQGLAGRVGVKKCDLF